MILQFYVLEHIKHILWDYNSGSNAVGNHEVILAWQYVLRSPQAVSHATRSLVHTYFCVMDPFSSSSLPRFCIKPIYHDHTS